MQDAIPFESLPTADLVLGALYEGGTTGNVGSDPLTRLFQGIGNQGGFRPCGKPAIGECPFVVLFTTGREAEWPDDLDRRTGRFHYYGDNRSPGTLLHETKRGGNRLLAEVFEFLHRFPDKRHRIPPFFVFERTTKWNIRFKGLAVPGAVGASSLTDLVALWNYEGSEPFQNYRALFTILDCPVISRRWIEDLRAGQPASAAAPAAWAEWAQTGRYLPYREAPPPPYREKAAQMPADEAARASLLATHEFFVRAPGGFGRYAAAIWSMLTPNAIADTISPTSADGASTILGTISVGAATAPVPLRFSLEARCFPESRGATVSDIEALLPHLESSAVGAFMTTSYIEPACYDALTTLERPVAVITGTDLANALLARGVDTPSDVRRYLGSHFS